MARKDRSQGVLEGIGGPSFGRPVARVRRGVDTQLRSLEPRPDDAGFRAMARTLADAIDAEHTDPDGSRFTVGALCARLFPVLILLRGADDAGGGDDWSLFLAQIRDAARSQPPDGRALDLRDP